jgi:hypothetical protein
MAVISRRFAQDIDIRWELSQILPYRGANRALAGGFPAAHCLKAPLSAVDRLASLREIVNELI